MSILDGTGDLVDKWLGLREIGKPPFYKSKTATNHMSRNQQTIVGTAEFLEACYSCIDNNWNARTYSNPSRENWRWKRHTDLALNNTSPEAILERGIVKACGDDWSNQIPVESGVVSSSKGRAAIDLVHRTSPTSYSFIELKVVSNPPLYAAIEILMYGILFVWSKQNMEQLRYDIHEQPILEGNSIVFEVLAPAEYYLGANLRNLQLVLNKELGVFGDNRGLELGFRFTQLGAEHGPDCSPDNIRSSIDQRRLVWPG